MGFFKKIFGGIVDDLKKSFEDSKQEVHDELVSKSSTSSTSSKPRCESGKKQNAKQVKKQDETIKKPKETSKAKSTKQPKGTVKQPKETPKAKKTEQPKEIVVEKHSKISSIETNEKESKEKEPVSAPPFDSMVEEAESQSTSDDGVFSARLEALISSALQDGVLTEQEKTILKKRAEAEGEDWDEVEMIINSRLAEMQNKSKPEQISDSSVIANSDDLCNQKIVTLYDCGSDTSSVGDAILDVIGPAAMAAKNIPYTLSLSTRDILKRCFAVEKEGKASPFELDSIETAKQLMEEIEKAGGKAHLGNPTPEEMIVKVYKGNSKDKDKSYLEIPEGVVKIDNLACSDFNMEEVKLPSTLKKIGASAFRDCKGLKNIIIPENVEYIEGSAFFSSGLKSVTILSKHLKIIGEGAFELCEKLKNISFPNGMEQIRIDDDAIPEDAEVFLPSSMRKISGSGIRCVYCFSPCLDELEELVHRHGTYLYVLPNYLKEDKSQAVAEEIDDITILPMPDEYLYFYDN